MSHLQDSIQVFRVACRMLFPLATSSAPGAPTIVGKEPFGMDTANSYRESGDRAAAARSIHLTSLAPAAVAGAWASSIETLEGTEQHWLYLGSCVRIADWRCLVKTAQITGERQLPYHALAFTHRGAHRLHTSQGSGLVDASCVGLVNPRTPFQTSHPGGCGDAGIDIVVRPDVLQSLVAASGGAPHEATAGLFEGLLAPCSSRLLLLQRGLVRRLRGAIAPDPLEIEETAIHVVADVLAGFYALRAAAGRGTVHRRTREKIELAREIIARRFAEPLHLEELARACHLSVDRLCRSFRAVTSTTVHRYISRLRLNAALERLSQGEPDLTELALDLGYSSHSHFTAAFHHELGLLPSEWRDRSSASGRAAAAPIRH